MALSFATRSNADLLDENYARWRQDPSAVDAVWAAFFEGFELGSVQSKNGAATTDAAVSADADAPLQTRVDGLVYAYRTLGHTIAQLDPLADGRPQNALLSLRELGFAEKDLDLTVGSKFLLGGARMPLRKMLAALEAIYCGPVGAEFMHIQNPRVRNWVREKIESRPPDSAVPAGVQRRMLRELAKVESFELAKTVVHRNGTLRGGTGEFSAVELPADYTKTGKALAERRGVLAGYRIAEKLKAALK